MRHLVTLCDLTSDEIERIFAITEDLKTKLSGGLREPLLPGRVVALMFEKPSLRTRVSFESGMAHLGGSSLFLMDDVGFGQRESTADFARVISQYVDGVVVRTRSHDTVVELAEYCTCSVINGLTDFAHPCQALADLYTLQERFGPLEGKTLAFVGDANNVAFSLALGCGKLGVKMRLATPDGYRFDDKSTACLEREVPELDLAVTADPLEAAGGAMAVYTDVWASMGQESETQQRRKDFAAYQVDARILSAAADDALFMHCLPAHRGEEVAAEVIDGPQSVVIEQAGNRMHVQKGILTWLLGAQA